MVFFVLMFLFSFKCCKYCIIRFVILLGKFVVVLIFNLIDIFGFFVFFILRVLLLMFLFDDWFFLVVFCLEEVVVSKVFDFFGVLVLILFLIFCKIIKIK